MILKLSTVFKSYTNYCTQTMIFSKKTYFILQLNPPPRDIIPLSALFIRGKKERHVGGWVGGSRKNRRKETKTKKVELNKQKQNKNYYLLFINT